mgnify:FL=1
MDFFAWLELATAMGIACLPVMRRWTQVVAEIGDPQYAQVWIRAVHLPLNTREIITL